MKPALQPVVRLAFAMMVIAGPAAVEAQQVRSERPYRGLFGGPSDPNSPQTLSLTGSIFAGYDDMAVPERGGLRQLAAPSGYSNGAEALLQFSRSGDKGSFAASGAASGRYYTEDSEFVGSYNAGLRFSRTLGRRNSFGGDYSVLYLPNWQLDHFPGFLDARSVADETAGLNPDPVEAARASYRHSGGLSFSHTLSSRSALSFTYTARHVDYVEGLRPDFTSHAAAGRFTRQMTSNTSVVLGYGYRTAASAPDGRQTPAVHDIDAGVNYSRALSFSRRTSVGFSTGSTIVVADQLSEVDTPTSTRLRLIGSARLTHEMGRSWMTNVAYNRGLVFHDAFGEAFFTDSVAANLTGVPWRRVDVSAQGAWTHATQSSNGSEGYGSLSGSAQLRYALSRYLGAYVTYLYYRYEFTERFTIDPQFSGALDRSGVRAGLSVAIPLIR